MALLSLIIHTPFFDYHNIYGNTEAEKPLNVKHVLSIF